MKICIELPDYEAEEGGIDVIWHKGSCVEIDSTDEAVYICANKIGLRSLGEQMIYLAENDVAPGTHIHFDDFFCGKDLQGKSLVIGKTEDKS